MTEVTPETVQRIWEITLVVFAVVFVVVAVLLTLILRTARQILRGVSAIWTVGQKVANNTIQIALLDTTSALVGRILLSAVEVIRATAALRAHAEQCPQCPACVLGSWSR